MLSDPCQGKVWEQQPQKRKSEGPWEVEYVVKSWHSTQELIAKDFEEKQVKTKQHDSDEEAIHVGA